MIYSQSESEIIFSSNSAIEIAKIQEVWSGKIFILTDENTLRYCLPKIISADNQQIKNITIKAGEKFKHIQTVEEVWEFLNSNGADRKSLLINLGGGVLCDLGGFAASTFKRGLDFIHIPTTLLSQVDASVGGKTGVNFKSFKNEIGCFSFPRKVIIDPIFLETLDNENILSGYAEMLKHAFISGQDDYKKLQKFEMTKSKMDYASLIDLIKHSVEIKGKIVLEDPMETGLRKVLNFGHTIGHAFESFYLDSTNEISHGKAVAYGMAVELYLSHKKLGFQKNKLYESVKYINTIFGKPYFKPSDYEVLYNLMTHDKKNESAQINFTLLKDFGHPVYDQTAKKEEIFEGFELYLKN
jgi:3-dehydroquinate synthase